jgi:hypothetical protein
MIHTDEDDEFERIERENIMKAQQRMFEHTFHQVVRNQTLEEAARVADGWSGHYQAEEIAKEIRSLKK